MIRYGRTETTYKKRNDNEKGQCEQLKMKGKQMKGKQMKGEKEEENKEKEVR